MCQADVEPLEAALIDQEFQRFVDHVRDSLEGKRDPVERFLVAKIVVSDPPRGPFDGRDRQPYDRTANALAAMSHRTELFAHLLADMLPASAPIFRLTGSPSRPDSFSRNGFSDWIELSSPKDFATWVYAHTNAPPIKTISVERQKSRLFSTYWKTVGHVSAVKLTDGRHDIVQGSAVHIPPWYLCEDGKIGGFWNERIVETGNGSGPSYWTPDAGNAFQGWHDLDLEWLVLIARSVKLVDPPIAKRRTVYG